MNYEVIKTKSELPLVDLLDGARHEIKVHEHGMVALVDVMPRLVPQGLTADSAIVQAARVSYGAGTKAFSEDRSLIRYLYRHKHTTPLEMVEFKFHHVMPIFVARQWIRHRTANVNEYSARYSVVKDRFYIPTTENLRAQSKTNKQGGTEPMDEVSANSFLTALDKSADQAYQEYEKAVADGVSREQARLILPINAYTEWYWKIDLHNLLHFLGLRMDKHAQQEIQDYAKPMFHLITELAPLACEAFMDYHPNMGGMMLSRQEIEALALDNPKGVFESLVDNQRERTEFFAKVDRLNL